MALKVWELPWRPTVLISGRSYYTVDPVSGLITQHKDVWDALDNNQFPSPEALALLVQKVGNGRGVAGGWDTCGLGSDCAWSCCQCPCVCLAAGSRTCLLHR